jgi:hypothetical protein
MVNNAAMNVGMQVSPQHTDCNSFGIYSVVGFLDLYDKSIFSYCFQKVAVLIYNTNSV